MYGLTVSVTVMVVAGWV
jgi:hypothetical protein